MKKEEKKNLSEVDQVWGEKPEDNFGYSSDEERLRKRGMEDWELTEKIPQSQKKVPYWFFAIVLTVLLVALGLSFPFWGLRPGDEDKPWLDWGFGVAILYLLVGGSFVYYMVTHQSGPTEEDSDEDRKEKN